ncbi:MAG: zinc-dependent alcohol dehydrogenase [Acidimicrobiales bacterium]
MKALVFERRPVRFAAARVASSLVGSGHGVGVGPLELLDVAPPDLPGGDWVRVRPRLAGICGSDLATLDGRSSRYFEHLVSFPFVPGHEIVGDVNGGSLDGQRVVVESVLGCEARGMAPLCGPCAEGDTGRCHNTAFGELSAGLQTGYCAETGGGWSEGLVVHDSQLYQVPEQLSDEAAVMIEPAACGVHAAFSVMPSVSRTRTLVLGAGTLGLCTIAALRSYLQPGLLVAVAKYPEQKELARAFGADHVVEPSDMLRTVRRLTGSLALSDAGGKIERTTGGLDVVFDCVGSPASLASSLSVVRPGGEIVLVGMPGSIRVDLAPLWHREIRLRGAYAYGTEQTDSGPRRTFDLAAELVSAQGLGQLVSASYRLEHYEQAIAHAAAAGRRGAVKVVFDMRRPPTRGSDVESLSGTTKDSPIKDKETP